jgi:hypothetical protein
VFTLIALNTLPKEPPFSMGVGVHTGTLAARVVILSDHALRAYHNHL